MNSPLPGGITAEDFARKWIESWNSHNVDEILNHYSADVRYFSPFVVKLGVDASGLLQGHAALRTYFLRGLAAYPDLTFKLHAAFTGVDSLLIHYASVASLDAAELFVLDESGRAIEVRCHYVVAARSEP